MLYRNRKGELRVSPPLYKLLLVTHIIVSVGWLGIASAKLALGIAAATGDPDLSSGLYTSMPTLNAMFPPAAVGTFLTGVALSLGTKWGLLSYYWVVAKLGLTIGVITTGILFVDQLIRESAAATSGQAANAGGILGISPAPTVLTFLSIAHVLMLGAAATISVYKPWGKIRSRRHKAGSGH